MSMNLCNQLDKAGLHFKFSKKNVQYTWQVTNFCQIVVYLHFENIAILFNMNGEKKIAIENENGRYTH